MSLSDRSYASRPPSNFDVTPSNSALKAILWSCIVVFIIQNIAEYWGQVSWIEDYFGLSLLNVSQGLVWTPLSYAFLHDVGSIFHILLNLLVIFFIGRVLEPILGNKHFIYLYFSCLVGGSILWLLTHVQHPDTLLLGASSAALGLMIFFCLLQPEEPITFLLFLAIPITIKPKWLGWSIVGIEAMGFLFQELPSQGLAGAAYSAHLGGILAAYLFYKFFYLYHCSQIVAPSTTFSFKDFFSRWWPKKAVTKKILGYSVNMADRLQLRKEVDGILDKINNQGFASLTSEEKKILDQAKDLLQ